MVRDPLRRDRAKIMVHDWLVTRTKSVSPQSITSLVKAVCVSDAPNCSNASLSSWLAW